MKIIYNDVDITADVQPITLKLTDNAEGRPDSITVVFSDNRGLWSKWGPKKNDTVRVTHEGYDSGVMYIDHLGQMTGKFEIKALSIPQTAKTARSQAWEGVRLLEIATEIASRYGFGLRTYSITNHLYQRVDQIEQGDFSFLADRCKLEGYALKITDRSIVIYDEQTFEQRDADQQSTIYQHDMTGEYEFVNKSIDIYGKCIIKSQTAKGYIQAEYADSAIHGPTLTLHLYANDQSEAQRWARGVLRSYNKHMITGRFVTNLRTGYAAASILNIRDLGLFDGKYIVHRVVHDLINNRSEFIVRKPLGGY